MNNGEEGPELASRDKREILPYDWYRRPWCGRVIMDFRVMSRLSKGPVTLNVLGVLSQYGPRPNYSPRADTQKRDDGGEGFRARNVTQGCYRRTLLEVLRPGAKFVGV